MEVALGTGIFADVHATPSKLSLSVRVSRRCACFVCMNLTIRGRLTAETGLPQYTWEATNGIRVVVNGANVEAYCSKAPGTNSINAFREMKDEVERAILVENLETVSPLSIRWEEYQEDGSPVFTPTLEQSWNLRQARQPLHQYGGP
jgi:hypothetical protein